MLVAAAGAIVAEAWRRLQAPPEVQSLPMLAVAAVGLAVNLVGVGLLRGGAGESLNVAGAFQEVLADLLGSLAALAAGATMLLTGWWYADPLCSVAVALLVLPRTWRLLREAVHVLLEGTPPGVDLAAVRAALRAVPGVRAVHDLHVWSITSGSAALSAHVLLDGDPGGACAGAAALRAGRPPPGAVRPRPHDAPARGPRRRGGRAGRLSQAARAARRRGDAPDPSGGGGGWSRTTTRCRRHSARTRRIMIQKSRSPRRSRGARPGAHREGQVLPEEQVLHQACVAVGEQHAQGAQRKPEPFLHGRSLPRVHLPILAAGRLASRPSPLRSEEVNGAASAASRASAEAGWGADWSLRPAPDPAVVG